MNKEEFLRILRENLVGVLSENGIEQIIEYYDKYISNGDEQKVLKELGDPRLIAKSIKAANKKSNGRESFDYKNVDEDLNHKKFSKGMKNFTLDLSSFPNKVAAIIFIVIMGIIVLFLLAGLTYLFFVISFAILRLIIIFGIPLVVAYFIIKQLKKK